MANLIKINAVLSVAFLASCGTLSPAAQRIKFASKPEVARCRFLSVVYGGKQAGELFPKNAALENAANHGATHVVTLYDQDGKYTADAFDCDRAPDVILANASLSPPTPVQPPTPAPVVAAEKPAPSAVAAPPRSMAAKPNWVVAVMNVESHAGVSLDKGLLDNVGSQLRITIATRGVRTIDPSAQDSAMKAHIKNMKSESYKGCYDDQCQIELGKALAASHILRTQVTRFGRVCVLNGELIDLKAEVAIGAASAQGDCTDEGFLSMIDEVAQRLVSG